MAAVNEAVPGDPSFITYLLTPDLCDCFFVVGNRDLVEPERIGVVKKMLLAHSVVLRSDMLAREMEDKKDVPVSDMYPDTFKNLLRFVYGYDNTGSLDFDEADNLLYVAEKYQVKSLKARLSSRLIKLLTPDNICGLLNNPACYKVLELDSAITKILQNETNKVLDTPEFLDLSSDALVKIVEQDVLNVPEIEVWKAAVRWAKHRTNPVSGEALRRVLEKPAKHIRVCTIDSDSPDFYSDTSDSEGCLYIRYFNKHEVGMVCLSKSSGQRDEGLVSFSNEVECRKRTSLLSHHLSFDYNNITEHSSCSFFVFTKSHAIELLPLKLISMKCPYSLVPKRLTYPLECTITVSRVTNYFDNTSTETPETISDSQDVDYGQEFTLPLTKGGKNIILHPNNKYKVEMRFDGNVLQYWSSDSRTWDEEHISVQPWFVNNYYRIPSKALHYGVLP